MSQKLSNEIVEAIIEIIDKEKADRKIANEIVRDDVFGILDCHCIILFYPLDDENINGYHISRRIKDKETDFVFINTANTTEKQVFAAAHELGHILKVDETICNRFSLPLSDMSEDIVNRFAAELLMPKKTFNEKINRMFSILNLKNDRISIVNMLTIIVYLMNEFLVEYEAIVRRFNELGKITDDDKELLLAFKSNENFEENMIDVAKAANFTRLFIRSNNKSMSGLIENAEKAFETDAMTEERIEKILSNFGVTIDSFACNKSREGNISIINE